MKKLFIFIALALALTACFPATPANNEAEIQTRVAQVLTTFPTSTPAPTLPPTATPVPPTETLAPTATSTQAATSTPLIAQPTLAVTLNPTQIVAATQTAAVTTATTTVTPNPTYQTGDPRATLGNPTWTDPMDNGGNWPMAVSDFTSISFNGGEMVLTTLSNVSGWRLAGGTDSLSSAYIEMTGKLVTCASNDSFGIIFRVPVLGDANKGYLFGIQCDGQYYLKSYDATLGVNGTTVVIVTPTANPAIVAGAGKTNRIGVWMKGTTMKLYANGVLLKELTDSTFSKGYFGAFIRKGVTNELTARITEMDYWIIP